MTELPYFHNNLLDQPESQVVLLYFYTLRQFLTAISFAIAVLEVGRKRDSNYVIIAE